MKVTAREIQQKEFATAMRGLAREEVRAFLDQVAAQVEELAAENIALREDLKRRDDRITELAAREKLLEQTLVSAQRTADDMKTQAHKEAENIVAEAELRAEIIVQQANERLVDVVGQITEMKRQRALFAAQIKAAAEAQLSVLEAMSKEPAAVGDHVARLPRAANAEE